jgi:hypothetical protein
VKVSLIRFLGFSPFHQTENHSGNPEWRIALLPGRLCLCVSHPFTLMQDSLGGWTFHPNAGISPYAGSPSTILLPKEAFGPPTSPSYPHECMPWSQSPVVSQAHRHSAPRTAAFRRMHSVGFPLPLHRKIYPLDHHSINFGAQYTTCETSRYFRGTLDSSSFVLPLLGLHVDFTTDLSARLWSDGT